MDVFRFKYRECNISNLACQIRWHSISNLMVLLRSVALKEVVVWKGLQARRLADGKAATLHWIVVNEVMSILGNMAGNRS